MIEIGKYNTLKIERETREALVLVDGEGEEVLLSKERAPMQYEVGEEIEAFVYVDNHVKTATTQQPKGVVGDFVLLKAIDVNNVGAFMDWGLDKDLMVPFREQKHKMEPNRSYLIYIDLDDESDRLFGSSKVDNRLQNGILTVKERQEVDLIVYQRTDLGFNVIVNSMHKGLIYKNEIFSDVRVGDHIFGYVKKVREDKLLDITLQPIGYKESNDQNSDFIFEVLDEQGGFLPFTDKSSPEDIKEEFSMSKKAFKRAIGDLYKQKKITIEESGIRKI